MGRRRSGSFVGGSFGGAAPKGNPSRTLSGNNLPSTNTLYVLAYLRIFLYLGDEA